MPTLTIDGKQVTAAAGTSVLEAAKQAGIEIPHYCYHKGLSVAGNCRMCMVEIEKMPKLQISCATVVADNMVVHTSNDKVKKARQGVQEFLFVMIAQMFEVSNNGIAALFANGIHYNSFVVSLGFAFNNFNSSFGTVD